MRKTDERLKEFVKKVRKDFSDAKIFLFGSRTKDDALEDSDFDVIIISSKFSGENFFDRTTKMYDYWAKGALDAFCYTPKEFEEKKSQIGFVSEAMKSHTEIME